MKKLLLPLLLVLLAGCAHSPEGNKPPPIVKMVRPNYPIYAYQHGITGSVKISYDVDASGHVSRLRILQAQPPGRFEDTVVAAVAHWRFAPNHPTQNIVMRLAFTINNDPLPDVPTPKPVTAANK